MLSVRNLLKVYKTKGGVEVRALDGISVDFPDKGMVFLLGKSGSGKSTLLNVAGGLDIPDSGEIIVKGRSSKNFSGSDFDSYRNTFIGFIFQEYNILNEFTVEQNIALALQLQNKKNDKEAVDKLLDDVDLTGLGKRKPNTLSGGQKQRVAIARALIKDPEIIMADEPTGALDSNTGKQVFDTLKKLSQERLIIIVSHDREFAEIYGDRIIELKDGKIMTDESKNLSQASSIGENICKVDDKTISIKNGADVSKEEFAKVWQMVQSGGGEIIISSDTKKVENFRKVNRIAADGAQEYFAETTEKDIKVKEHDGSKTKFIKSRLPLSHAVKIGASTLKAKPVRLILTVLISVLAFGLFGVVSTMMMYDGNFTAAKALEGRPYNSALLQKNYNVTVASVYYGKYDGRENTSEYEYTSKLTDLISSSEINALNNQSLGIRFAGVFTPQGNLDLRNNSNTFVRSYVNSQTSSGYYSYDSFAGFTDAGKDYFTNVFGASLAGDYPAANNEIAISKYMYEVFKTKGLKAYDSQISDPQINPYSGEVTLNTERDIIDKYIRLEYNTDRGTKYIDLKITGVYDTGIIDPVFNALKPEETAPVDPQELIELENEFTQAMTGSFHNIGIVSEGFYNAIGVQKSFNKSHGYSGGGVQESFNFSDYYIESGSSDYYLQFFLPQMISTLGDGIKIFSYTDGTAMPLSALDSLGINETVMPLNSLLTRAQMLNYSRQTEFGGFYEDTHEEFRVALEKLGAFYNGYSHDGNSEPSTLSQSDITVVINALNTDWNAWVKNGLTDGSSQYAIGDVNKMYYKNGSFAEIKGVFASEDSPRDFSGWILQNELLANSGASYYYQMEENRTNYTLSTDGKYVALITPMRTEMTQLDYILSLNKAGADDSFFEMPLNEIYNAASYAASMISDITFVFIIIGIILAALSALLLFNYISVSISDKTHDIGILRAVGARGADVFKIFFSESLIIALICTVLAVAGGFFGCIAVNYMLSTSMFALQILDFGAINGAIIFGAAMVVAFIATILPVTIAARRVPVESIRAA